MRDDFSQDTKWVLAHRANLICSNPHCEATTGGPQDDPSKALNIGVAAHITAASPGGARYDSSLSPEQRSSAINGVWLCQNCAKLVDSDPSVYPAELLQAWKTMREINARNSIGQTAPRVIETEAQRKSKKILESKNKPVMLVKLLTGQPALTLGSRPYAPIRVKIVECDEFFVLVLGDGWDKPRSIPMDNIRIGRDGVHNCLELMEYD
jgi:hypothetical protein